MGVRVLGIDPGSSATGWALLIAEGNRYRLEKCGVVRPRGKHRPERLADLQQRLSAVVDELTPDCAAVESSFAGRNPKSGLALAESRGVILAVLGGLWAALNFPLLFLVRLLNLADPPASDAADAIAVALTHIHLGATR